jgi:hypothetical protein
MPGFSDTSVLIQDNVGSAPALNKTLLFVPDLTGTITNRTKEYTSLASVAVDFPSTTKVYKAADRHFKEVKHRATFKVGRVAAGDVDITASLDALYAVDKDFFCLCTTSKNDTELKAIAAWLVGKPLIGTNSLEPTSAMLDSANSTDLANFLAGLSNNKMHCFAHYQAGVDASTIDLKVASEVATLTSASHGLRVGDNITISGHSDSAVNGNNTVLAVPTDGTFTVSVPGAANDATGEDVNYFARYEFPEVAHAARCLGENIGAVGWSGRTLTGITANNPNIFSADQMLVLRNKKYTTYEVANNNIRTTFGGKMPTGRFVSNESVRVYLDVNLKVEIDNVKTSVLKTPNTDNGYNLWRKAVKIPLKRQLSEGFGGLTPLNDQDPYIVNIAKASTLTAAERAAGTMPDIIITAQLSGEVDSVTINASLLV